MERQDIEASHRFRKADRQKIKNNNCATHKQKKLQKKVLSNKKKLGKLIVESTILATVQKYLPVKI